MRYYLLSGILIICFFFNATTLRAQKSNLISSVRIVCIDKETRKPIKGVAFHLYYDDYWQKGDTTKEIFSSLSNAEGKCSYKGLSEKKFYVLTFDKKGYEKVIFPLSLNHKDSIRLSVEMENSSLFNPEKGYIEGKVVDDLTRVPLDSVRMRLWLYGTESSMIPLKRAYSDQKGWFKFSDLDCNKKYDVDFFKDNYEDVHFNNYTVIKNTILLLSRRIHNYYTDSITVICIDKVTGNPINGVSVNVYIPKSWRKDDTAKKITSLLSNANGKSILKGLDGKETYVILLEKRGYENVTFPPINLEFIGSYNLNIEMEKASLFNPAKGYIEGKIVDDSTEIPLDSVQVTLQCVTGGKQVYSDKGWFRFSDLDPSESYSLEFSKKNYQRISIRGFGIMGNAILLLSRPLLHYNK